MRKRTSDYSSDTEHQLQLNPNMKRTMVDMQQDLSLLRRSTQIGTAFIAAKTAYESGNDEVRRLLAEECSLIFECNACRNMFRDLNNFISHKQFYCYVANPAAPCAGTTNGFPGPKGSAVIANSTLITNTVDLLNNGSNVTSSSISDADNIGGASAVGLEIATGLVYDQPQLQVNHEGHATSRLVAAPSTGQHIVKLEEQEDEVTSLISKMESVFCASEIAHCKTQEILEQKAVENEPQKKIVSGSAKYPCGMCKLEFQTEKLLKIHVQKKHMSTAHAFKCPSCAMTFMQPAAVIRHLANDHKKSMRRIRVSRDHSAKRRSQPDETQAKSGCSRELKRLQSTEDNGSTNINDDNGVEKKKVMSNCIYCEKSFERRAALSTHLMSCPVKLEALEKPTPIKRPKFQSPPADAVPLHMDGIVKQDLIISPKYLAAAGEESTPPATADLITQIIKTEFTDSNSMNEMFAKFNNQNFEPGLKTVTLDKLDRSSSESEEQEQESQSSCPTLADVFETTPLPAVLADQLLTINPASNSATEGVENSNEQLANTRERCNGDVNKPKEEAANESDGSQKTKSRELSCRCKICNKQFNALSNLRRHISMFHYRARKFGCKLCDYRAFRRYDIVNHLCFVHKMTDDREKMATVYVSVHEVQYSKDDMDGDIVLINSAELAVVTKAVSASSVRNGEPPAKGFEKRSRRSTKAVIASGAVVTTSSGDGQARTSESADCRPTRQKLKRAAAASVSFDSGTSKSAQQRRPIRNRIKPENKDFVYDLSSLLKEEATSGAAVLDEPQRQLKRRNTIYNGISTMLHETPSKSLAPLITAECKQAVKGATRRLCLLRVQEGRAKSATLPELPSQRPQMRPRLTSTCRVDMQAVPVIETSDLEAARRRSTLLEETFLEKISRRAASEFRIKPCLELEHSALDTLLQKVDSSLQHWNHNQHLQQNCLSPAVDMPHELNEAFSNSVALNFENMASVVAPMSPGAVCPLAASGSMMIANGDRKHFATPLPSIPSASSPPPTPRKRITLVQRMAENKAKRRDSLLRTALEN